MEDFDFTYIDDQLIGQIQNNLLSVADILATVEKKATGKTTATSSLSMSLTTDKCIIPVFNLSINS